MTEQSTDLCEYSTSDLVDELCKREGVSDYDVESNTYFRIKPAFSARILVVKE